MRDKDINAEIMALKSTLTGDLFKDMGTHQEIYELKKILNPEIVSNPEFDEDDDCLACGS
tara:strand:+ start:1989 stop:2168 length:180 start_codon:yes stop_codon:yes gene_type:complete